MSFGISDPSKGHLKSHEEVIYKSQFVLQISFKKIKFKIRQGYCITVSVSSTHIRHDLI